MHMLEVTLGIRVDTTTRLCVLLEAAEPYVMINLANPASHISLDPKAGPASYQLDYAIAKPPATRPKPFGWCIFGSSCPYSLYSA